MNADRYRFLANEREELADARPEYPIVAAKFREDASVLRSAADEVEHWIRIAARLGERLDDAPHDRRCSSFVWNGKGWDVDEASCDCWRAE